MNNTRILCVIIHFRDAELTWNCVESVLKNKNVDIIIVDNDAKQDLEVIDPYKAKIKLVKTGGNIGFAAANNWGVRAGRAKDHFAVLLLNNDTIVVNDAIDRLMSLLLQEKVGAVGPCMPYLDYPTKIWACGGYVNKAKVVIGAIQNVNNNDVPFEVGYLPGAAILCRLDLWDKAEGLPEKYFLGYEEAELALKIKRMGFKIMADPKAIILHKVGMSSERKPKYDYNDVRNRMKFGGFLLGKLIGPLWVIAITLRSMILNRSKFSIWAAAVIDELRNVRLDYSSLSKIENKYRST